MRSFRIKNGPSALAETTERLHPGAFRGVGSGRMPFLMSGLVAGLLFISYPAAAQVTNARPSSEPLSAALSPQTWALVEQSIDRALTWLARQQSADGAFQGPPAAQPAATSFAVMAFLSRGHVPGEGPYGAQLEKAIDYVLRTQQSDGLLAHSMKKSCMKPPSRRPQAAA